MVEYSRLPASSMQFDFNYISSNLKTFGNKLKEMEKADYNQGKKLRIESESIRDNLEEIFQQRRVQLYDKAKHATLEANFKEICAKYQKIKQSFDRIEESNSMLSEYSLGSRSLLERESLVFISAMQVNEDIDLEKKKQFQALNNDVVIIKELFVDMSKLVGEQDEMLRSIENNMEVAEKSTGRAEKDLQKANKYKSDADRRKLLIWGIVLLLVLGALVFLFITYYDRITGLF